MAGEVYRGLVWTWPLEVADELAVVEAGRVSQGAGEASGTAGEAPGTLSRIDSMLYERTALSKKPAKLIEQDLKALREEDRLTPDLVFRDPYMLDFLSLRDTYSEQDLESALLREIESFLLELGVGFAFVERQKRITLDGDDYYLDLLFYHGSCAGSWSSS